MMPRSALARAQISRSCSASTSGHISPSAVPAHRNSRRLGGRRKEPACSAQGGVRRISFFKRDLGARRRRLPRGLCPDLNESDDASHRDLSDVALGSVVAPRRSPSARSGKKKAIGTRVGRGDRDVRALGPSPEAGEHLLRVRSAAGVSGRRPARAQSTSSSAQHAAVRSSSLVAREAVGPSKI